MKRTHSKHLALALIGGFAFGGVALAGPGTDLVKHGKDGGMHGKHRGMHGEHGGKMHPEMMAKFDVNKDGKLDEAERKAMHDAKFAKKEELLKKFDANKDGSLDDAEKKALRDAKMAERFKALDKDGNGSLSLEEFKAGKRGGGFMR